MTDDTKPESASERDEKKPREFWCLPSRQQDIRNGFGPIGSITEVEPPAGTEFIRVIEKSAYDRQEKTILELRAALEFYADEKNWYDVNKMKPDAPKLRMAIASIDTEGPDWIGGFYARKALTRTETP